MPPPARALHLLAAALAIAAWSLPVPVVQAGSAPGGKKDEPPPGFALPDLEGRPVILSASGGGPVVLHFWASWCPHCVGEMKILQSLVDEMGTQAPRVLAINLGEPAARVQRFARQLGLRYPILLDRRGKVAQAYGVVGLPVTLVISPQGTVERSVRMGDLDAEALRALLQTYSAPAR